MHADPRQLQQGENDTLVAVVAALGLHLLLALVLLLAGWWQPAPKVVSVAGPVIEAALVISSADLRQAERAMEATPEPAPEDLAPPPQPEPEPAPQTAREEPQPAPQAPQAEPDTRDQERAARLAIEQAEQREREEQEERRRQEQVDLTERQRQQEAEQKQRRREQYEAKVREREAAERRTRMEEMRLAQLADRQKPTPRPEPAPAGAPRAGNEGTDDDLQARYVQAMNQTARANWNTALAPEMMRCRVRFTQIPPGDVIDVQFLDCSYDAQGKDSVDRALRKTPMPYDEFKSVFARQVEMTFCYPEEACNR